MSRGFQPLRGSYVAKLDAAEARLVRGLATDVLELLNERVEETEGRLLSDAPLVAEGQEVVTPWWEELGLSNSDLAGAMDDAATEGEATATPDARRRARPDDPALARLLPDMVAEGHADDGEAERMRALTEPGLLSSKREALIEAASILQGTPVTVPADAAPRFAAALNDIRLVLAQRLGIETAEDAERIHEAEEPEDGDDADEVAFYLGRLYEYVSWLQESLMNAMMRRRH